MSPACQRLVNGRLSVQRLQGDGGVNLDRGAKGRTGKAGGNPCGAGTLSGLARYAGVIIQGAMPMTRTLALLAMFGLVACETVEGAGRDITTAGQVITEEAQTAGN